MEGGTRLCGLAPPACLSPHEPISKIITENRPTDRLQCQEGIGGSFGRVFCPSRCGGRASSTPTPHGPAAPVVAQEAEDDHPHPARVFRLVPAPSVHPAKSRPRGGHP